MVPVSLVSILLPIQNQNLKIIMELFIKKIMTVMLDNVLGSLYLYWKKQYTNAIDQQSFSEYFFSWLSVQDSKVTFFRNILS